MSNRNFNTNDPLWFANLFSNEPTKLFIVILLSIIIVWLTLAMPIVWLAGVATESSGRIGDTFGIVNSLFSALGFAALTYTLIQQNRTIKQQEQDTRVDRFESKFFQMLAAQREIVNEMDLKRKVRTVYPNGGRSVKREVATKGRECFRIIYRQHFVNFIFDSYQETHGYEIDDHRRKDRNASELVDLNYLIYVYEHKLFPMFQNDLGHYFRHLYYIVDMLDKADYISDKSEYVGIIRAQMSMYELLLLFYNGLSRYGEHKFKPLIEKHALLKSISEGNLINGSFDMYDRNTNEALSNGYQHSAFGLGVYLPRDLKKEAEAMQTIEGMFDDL